MGLGSYGGKTGAQIVTEAQLQSIIDGTCHKEIVDVIRECRPGTLRDVAKLIIESGTEKQTPQRTQQLLGTRDRGPGALHPTEGIYDLNVYAAILMGVYEKDFGKNKKSIIKPTEHDRSMFNQVKYQFFLDAPFEISNQCCAIMKKRPIHDYAKKTGRKPFTAQMAEESRLRTQQWIKNGCNGFQMKSPISNPMSFWTENDVLQYIAENHLPICSVYGDVVEDYGEQLEGQMDLSDYGLAEPEKKYKTTGCKRTGCMLCGFGCHLEKPGEGRFEMLKQTHPKMYQALDLIQNNGVTFRQAIEWTNEHGGLNIPL
jgi:3'-phosphoadenosine 5'-phosphosulfate sulfotransferase (PAPS reductase)/FAD synthetase